MKYLICPADNKCKNPQGRWGCELGGNIRPCEGCWNTPGTNALGFCPPKDSPEENRPCPHHKGGE
ncbi:MAG TPA: hypothetical protein VF390_01385 [Patescibacteria group bacterium]